MRESNDNRIGTRMGEDCRIWRESEWILPRKVADGQNRPGTRQIPIVRGGKLPSKTTIWRWWKEKSIRYIKQGCSETWVHCKQLSWIKVVSSCVEPFSLMTLCRWAGWKSGWWASVVAFDIKSELNWQAEPFCTCACWGQNITITINIWPSKCWVSCELCWVAWVSFRCIKTKCWDPEHVEVVRHEHWAEWKKENQCHPTTSAWFEHKEPLLEQMKTRDECWNVKSRKSEIKFHLKVETLRGQKRRQMRTFWRIIGGRGVVLHLILTRRRVTE